MRCRQEMSSRTVSAVDSRFDGPPGGPTGGPGSVAYSHGSPVPASVHWYVQGIGLGFSGEHAPSSEEPVSAWIVSHAVHQSGGKGSGSEAMNSSHVAYTGAPSGCAKPSIRLT